MKVGSGYSEWNEVVVRDGDLEKRVVTSSL